MRFAVDIPLFLRRLRDRIRPLRGRQHVKNACCREGHCRDGGFGTLERRLDNHPCKHAPGETARYVVP